MSNTRSKLMSIFERPSAASAAPSNAGGGSKAGNTSGLNEFASGRETGLNRSGLQDPGTGIVLVFDLDQTIIDSSYVSFPISVYDTVRTLNNKPFIVNERLMNTVIFPAAALRESYKVSAILMLTNNSSADYIAGVSKYIYNDIKKKFKMVGIPITTITKGMYGQTDAGKARKDVTGLPENDYFFDYIMTRTSQGRAGDPGNPVKRLEDVKNMLAKLGKSTKNLESRVFMFDDKKDHMIGKELDPPINYILIKSKDKDTGANVPFQVGSEEITNYNPIKGVLSGLSGDNLSAELNNSMKNYSIDDFAKLFEGNKKVGGKRIRRRFVTRSKKLKSHSRKQTRHRKLRQRGAGEKCVVYGENGSIQDTWDCAASCNYDKEKTDRCKPYE